MRRWLSFGASEIGPAHIASGKSNQDAWAAFHHFGCDVLVVADGVGSKDYSELASAGACRAVDQVVSNRIFAGSSMNLDDDEVKAEFLDDIRDAWIDSIKPLTSDDATTTCLFALRNGSGKVWMAMLGDGCAATVMKNGAVQLLQDDKEESFSNMTQSLTESTEATDWRVVGVPEDKCKAVLLCTDGIADDLVDVEGFVASLVENYCNLPVTTAASEVMSMLLDWPTPKHSDDKTLACLFEREYGDE